MKKSFLKTFIVLVVFGFFVLQNTFFVSAQIEYPVEYPETNIRQVEQGETSNEFVRLGLNWLAGKGAEFLVNDPIGAVKNFWNCTINPVACAIGTGSYAAIQFSGLALFIAGNIFDMIFTYTVNGLDAGVRESVVNAWKIIRDLGNIFIVFSLLYLGIKTILQGNGFAETKILVGIIIAAILINFSLIFTEVAFNVSNVIGAQIGEQITFDAGGSGGVLSISAGLTKMIRPDGVGSFVFSPDKQEWAQIWDKVQVSIFVTTATLLLAGILFGSAILLMYRYVLFVFLMITSPFGLASKFIPWFSSMSEKWWKALKTQFIVFPAFLLTLYISILFVAPLSTNLMGNAFQTASISGGITSYSGELVKFIFNYILIIGFLLAPLLLPGKIGAAGSDMMTNIGNWTTNKIKNAPKQLGQRTVQFGASATARTGRTVLGGVVGRSLKDGKTMKKWAQNTDSGLGGFAKRTLGQAVVKTGAGLQNATFDVRNIDAVKKTDFGKGLGKGIEGWSKSVKTQKDALEKRKKDEMKLFGFDKLAETRENKLAISEAERVRDDSGRAITNKKAEIKSMEEQARVSAQKLRNNPTDQDVRDHRDLMTRLDAERLTLEGLEKTHERNEIEVGKLKNLGELKYMKQLEGRLIGGSSPLFTRNAGFYALKKDANDSWKKSGWSPDKKKQKAADKRDDKDLKDDDSGAKKDDSKKDADKDK